MKRKAKIVISLISLTIIFSALVTWYKWTVNIEDMNSMVYCTCGYAKVEFKDGNIYMIKYFHDEVKPGDCIGKYRVNGNDVSLSIYSRGKVYTHNYILDNIGLKNIKTGDFQREYHALNDKSLKTWLYILLKKIWNLTDLLHFQKNISENQ